MVWEGLGQEGVGGDGARVLSVACNVRLDLPAHPIEGVVIEAWLHQRQAQQRHRLVAVLR
jgi:hypothetical protein